MTIEQNNSDSTSSRADFNPKQSTASRVLRVAAQLAIVAFWGGMMFLLVRDFFLPPQVRSPMDAVESAEMRNAWRDYDEWSTINFLTLPFEGASHVSVKRREAENDYAFTARYVLHPKDDLSPESRVQFTMAARLKSDFTLDQFDLNVSFPGRTIEMRGLLADKILYYGIRGGDGDEKIGTMPLKGNLAFLDGLQSMLPRQMKLEVGQQFRFEAFDPVWNFRGGDVVMEVVSVEFLKIGDAEYEVYRVEFKFSNFVTTTWVTKEGEVVMRRIGNMLEMKQARPRDIKSLAGFDSPLAMPDYKTDDFVLYMQADDANRRPTGTGMFGLIGELLKAGNTP